MQSYSISVDYWLEALHGRVDVAFGQNAVFRGHEGYLHVRVLQEQEDDFTLTGMPGRPSKGKEIIEAEFQRRAATNECEQSLEGEARVLCAWFKRHHPLVGAPTQKTIQNNQSWP